MWANFPLLLTLDLLTDWAVSETQNSSLLCHKKQLKMHIFSGYMKSDDSKRACTPNTLPGYAVPLISEMYIENTRTNVEESDTYTANTQVESEVQLAGFTVTTGTVQLAQELQRWLRSDSLFSLLAAAQTLVSCSWAPCVLPSLQKRQTFPDDHTYQLWLEKG